MTQPQKATPKTARASKPPPPSKERVVDIDVSSGKTRDRLIADLAIDGMLGNALTLVKFSPGTLGALSLNDCALSLVESAKLIQGGDLSAAETMLLAQAVALNGIFGELARRAALNMGEHLTATETYLKLALKAQSQSRATLVALAEIKNPPAVFARQLNVANGPQQVNNGMPSTGTASRTHAHASENPSQQIELLEEQHGVVMDTRAQGTAGGADPHLEAVGTVHRPAHR